VSGMIPWLAGWAKPSRCTWGFLGHLSLQRASQAQEESWVTWLRAPVLGSWGGWLGMPAVLSSPTWGLERRDSAPPKCPQCSGRTHLTAQSWSCKPGDAARLKILGRARGVA
jgi:hypothetical protein